MSRNVIGCIVVVLAALMLGPWINRPFTGHHDFTGAFDSQMARNYLRYGLIKTKLGQVTNFGETNPESFTYHTHHPPGVPLLLAGSYALFGEHEWVARLTFALFALGSVYLFFLLVSDATTITIGTAATVLMISFPLFIYGSILPVYEAPALFLILLEFYCFSRQVKTGKKKYRLWLSASALLGYVTAWATYVAVPLLLLNELRLRRKTHFKILLILVVTSIFFFLLHVAHTKLLTGQWGGGGLEDIFLRRTGVVKDTEPGHTFSPWAYFTTVLTRLKNFYGWPAILVSMVGVVVLVLNPEQHELRSLTLFLTGTAFALPILFRNYVFVHDYTLYYFSPLCALTAVIGLSTIHFSKEKFLLIATGLLVLVNTWAAKEMWSELWTSIEWYDASPLIGAHLKQTTNPGQSILVLNALLKEQETQLEYYADRAMSFAEGGAPVQLQENPDVIVNVRSNLQLSSESKAELARQYRSEVERGVEYYYKK